MARCVAIVLFLIIFPSIFSEAVGNIGCLFSETLCNQEKEWCYDDYAFGRCLPLYGNIQDENMFRYNLGTDDLHTLEKEMQRLFQLGYRWSHTYTQCVLQILLNAMQEKVEFDISSCNVDLDQDLEGALKAMEGEDVDHIDPRNLAIVRFSPSVADPHSDYADEFYYPPVDEILPPYKPNEHGQDSEKSNAKQNVPTEESGIGNQSGSDKSTEILSRFIQPKTKVKSNINDKYLNNRKDELYLVPSDLSMFMKDDPRLRPVLDDYDDGYMRYENEPLVMPLVQKRANILERRMQQYDPEILKKDPTADLIFKKLLRRNPVSNRDLGELAEVLKNIRYGEHQDTGQRLHIIGEPVYSPAQSDRGGMYNYPDSRFRIAENSYYGRFPSNSFMSGPFKHEKTSGYVPFVSSYDRNMDSLETSQIPELEPPDEDSVSYISDEIHPRYEPPTPSTFFVKQNPESNSIYDVGTEKSLYENSVSRFDEKGQPVENKDMPMEIDQQLQYNLPSESVYKEHNGYRSNHNYNAKSGYHSEHQMNADQPDYSMYYYSHYPQYFDYDYYEYGGYPNAMSPMDSSAPANKEGNEHYRNNPGKSYNLERSERFDEKKPGPPFMKLKEDSNDVLAGMDRGPESLQGGGDWMMPMSKWMQGGLRYPFMNPGGVFYDENEMDSEGPVAGSALQFDEAVLDGAGDSSVDPSEDGQKEKLPKVAKHIGHPDSQKNSFFENSNEPEDTYIYITINGEFNRELDARQLIDAIRHYAKIENSKIDSLSVKKNVVAFKLKNLPPGFTPAELVECIEELRPRILEKTDFEIIQAGIETKTGLSGVAQRASNRKIEAGVAIVCGICGAILVSAIALFLLKRHAKSKAKLQGIASHDTEASKDYQDLCRARMANKTDSKDSSGTPAHSSGGNQPTTQRVSSLSKESENGNNSPSSRSSTSSWSEEPVVSNMDISTGHMVLSYMEDHLKNKDRLDQEWIDLCSYEAEPCACHIAHKGDNAKKNRYQDCVPYDNNRVILNEHTNVNGSNYINASSITDHDPRNPAYIATQGALPGTSADFWQLVWEQGSVVIVMLSRLTENCQSLCHRYWPEEGSELYHIYEVHLVSEHIWCDDYLVRSFYLKNVRTSETRTVTQFHFLSWPESGTPASTKALLEFRRKVNKSYRGRSCPIIVHCSDGVGRTGTYCLIDMVLNRMVKGSKEIDIAATLEHIRDQRPVMVKTKAQFEFVLMAVAEEVHAILKALPQ